MRDWGRHCALCSVLCVGWFCSPGPGASPVPLSPGLRVSQAHLGAVSLCVNKRNLLLFCLFWS